MAAREQLVTSLACCVSWKVFYPTPHFIYVYSPSTAYFTSQPLGRRISSVCGSCKHCCPKKKLIKILYYKQLLNLSRATKCGQPDIRPVPVLSDYLVKLVIPASRTILKPAVIYRVVSLLLFSHFIFIFKVNK